MLAGVVCALTLDLRDEKPPELVDIEVAPTPREVQALPAEVARPWEQDMAATMDEASAAAAAAPPEPEAIAVDAGVDAPIDAPIDAAPKKKKPDASIDAAVDPLVAEADGGIEPLAAVDDAGNGGDAGAGDATVVAVGEGSGSAAEGSGAGAGGAGSAAGGRGDEPPGEGSGVAGATNEPAVDGAPTLAGTAANLLAYFPKGHVVTAMIRFDRLRGTEWAVQTERLLRPMPDYQILFGPTDAEIANKLETLVISSPTPKDATATTLVARTKLPRAQLRAFLGATNPVTWSTAKGGLLGKRGGKLAPNDRRVFISPFKDWFLLAQPGDLGALTAGAAGNVDTAVATAKPPPWIAGIRGIEVESGVDRGPALVLTLALGGQTVELGDNDFGLGIKSVTTPDRVTLAMELDKKGWHVAGNMRFTSDAAAATFVTAAESAKQRIADSRALQLAMGKPVARVIANLRFARTGPRVSYTTSISIADARMILAVAAQQLDTYFAATPP
ncbi:MAG: hypothetical protein M4D80_21240 [Myxococcota bacterium]|nr:hypothetical protein [Myxococcota bacterium]